MKGLNARIGRHKTAKVDAPPIYCITFMGTTGIHYEYVQAHDVKQAVRYATKEGEALGVNFFIEGGVSLPKVLGSDESFKILESTT